MASKSSKKGSSAVTFKHMPLVKSQIVYELRPAVRFASVRSRKSFRRRVSYVLSSRSYGLISAVTIESARKVLRRLLGKKIRLLVRCFPFHTLTKKSSGVRMGKGKGSKFRALVAPLRPGQVVFEIPRDTVSNSLYMLSVLQRASKKLSGKFCFRIVRR